MQRRLVYPLIDLMRGTYSLRIYRWLEKTQWLAPEALRRVQTKKLARMLRFCQRNVAYFSHEFRRVGIDHSWTHPEEILPRIPLLTKEKIRSVPTTSIVTRGKRLENLKREQTGGSTGDPLVFYKDVNEISHQTAHLYRALCWYGWDFGKKNATIWGRRFNVPRRRIWARKIHQWISGDHMFDSDSMSDSIMHEYVKKINRLRPAIVGGYVSSLELLSDYVIRHGISIHKPCGVVTTAETLFTIQREKIQRAFKSPVFDQYGNSEINSVAFECPEHHGLHIAIEHVHLELIKDGEPVALGEEGEIYLTGLDNYGMPFIRYATRDIAIQSDEQNCPCGRGLPLLERIVGRTSNIIIGPNGNRIFGEFFAHVLMGLDLFEKLKISQFQVIQHSIDHLQLLIIAERDLNSDEIKGIASIIFQSLGKLKLNIQRVESIEPLRSGKHSSTISLIDRNQVFS